MSKRLLKRTSVVSVIVLAIALASSATATGEDLKPVQLPAPQTDGGKPLMQALKLRSTSRSFAPQPLPPQTMANLLWAAWGMNRPAEGKRTAPSARNWQEISVFVITKDGAFVYDAIPNLLKPVVSGDLRPLAGQQGFVKDAPLTLVYVADVSRMKGASADEQQSYAFADAAFVSENVYLFCASEGLATGVRAMVDRPELAKALKLGPSQIIALAQSVGYPKP